MTMEPWISLTGNDELGYEADVHGVYKPRPDEVVHVGLSEGYVKFIVLKSHGYSSNPGGRYSGLTAYYPPEVTVYQVLQRAGKAFKCRVVTSWDAGRGANKEKVRVPPQLHKKARE